MYYDIIGFNPRVYEPTTSPVKSILLILSINYFLAMGIIKKLHKDINKTFNISVCM